jgi:hypothetical protein
MTTPDDDMQSFQRELDEDDGSARTLWDPQPGGTLLGDLVRYEKRMTRIGEADVAVVREYETGALWSVFLTRSVLKNEFDQQSPRETDRIGIKFHGEKSTRNGDRTYMHYTLHVRRVPGTEPPQQVITTAPPTPLSSQSAPTTTAASAAGDDELPW